MNEKGRYDNCFKKFFLVYNKYLGKVKETQCKRWFNHNDSNNYTKTNPTI